MSETENTLDVLLIEDNQGDARLVRHHLSDGQLGELADGYELCHAETLTAALERLEGVEEGVFDVVFLDLGLPESEGLDTLDTVRSRADDVPIIVLTGHDDVEMARRAIQVGAQDYLPKNELDTDTLMRALRYAIERHAQEQELRLRTEQLELFNSVLRHDVHNGMDVIRRNAQLLERDLEGDDRDRVETIIDWSDNIIDLSKQVRRMIDAVAEDESIALDYIDLSAIVREQIDAIEGMEPDVEIETAVPDDVVVRADEMLDAVVHNVLSNAVEHNDEDHVAIDIEVEEVGDFVRLRIADNGPGIPESERDRIFGRGEQGALSDGSGFGLYFVDVMVDNYGGTIDVSDNEPQGTVFTIELPAP